MKITILSIFLLISSTLFASQFAELDKAPEGAHKGQMLLSGFVTIGSPFGDMITEEENLVSDNTYTLSNDTTKVLEISHIVFEYGINYEYIPISHVGIKSKIKKLSIIQRTVFGSDYKNWSETLYSNYSFFIGPSIHLTERKRWDVVFTPLIGYAIGKYNATPIASNLKLGDGYSGENQKQSMNSFAYGAELNFVAYFSGGFFFSIGMEYFNYPLSFSSEYDISLNDNTFMDGKTSGSISTATIAISAGYAFSN